MSVDASPEVECPACKGEGEVYPVTPIGFGLIPDPAECRWCLGKGHTDRSRAAQYRRRKR